MRMLKVLLALSLSAVFPLSLHAQTCSDGSNGTLAYSSSLYGSQFGGTGSSTGSGTGCFRIDPSNNTASVSLDATGISGSNRTASLVRRNSNGTMTTVLTLTNDQNTFDTDGTFDLDDIDLSQSLLNEILANPGNFSLVVGNQDYPSGALSGSLSSGRSYSGTFSGGSVVGSTGSTTGGGTFTADIVPNPNGSGSLLNYSFTPTGIGDSITSLGLYSGMIGTNGTLSQSLSNGGTLTNGRLTGSVAISNTLAQQLMTNPGGFYLSANTSQFPQGAVRAQVGATQYELFLPVAGSARGQFNSQWQTDLQILNEASGGDANVVVQMLGSGQSNASNGSLNAMHTANIGVLARATASRSNALSSLYGMNSGMGALRLVSDQPIIAIARIYDVNGDNGGTTAQPIYAMRRDEALASGVLVGAPAGNNGNGNGNDNSARTNIGFFNPNNMTVTVNLTWQSGRGMNSGDAEATNTLTLAPYEQRQMPLMGTNGAFASLQNGSSSGNVVGFQASAPIFAYSSVVNNGNGDAHVLMAKAAVMGGGLTDGQIAAIVMAANQGEVQQGSAAQARTSSNTVRQFAQQMVTEHSAALAQAQTLFTQQGITPEPNPTSMALTAESQQIVTQINARTGTSLDRYYMQSQVAVHSAVLATIDTLLLPSAQNGALRNLLQVQRAQVAMHLQEAREILEGIQ